jgi:methylenetetrahydrofolate dehydrogenase (NADP+)/methenyltetrahydrofolate cyclohydrolase
MSAQIIDGLAVAAEIRAELKERVSKLRARGFDPGLAFIIVGNNPASISYVKGKAQGCEEIGLRSQTFNLPEETAQEEVMALVEQLNDDPKWNGMIVQLPLPKHMDPDVVTSAVHPDKDVDGLHPFNQGRMLSGVPGPKSCTPAGVRELLIRTGNDPSGKNVVIVGRSNLVGKPLAAILMQKAPGANATVTVCHTGTRDIAHYTKQDDIVVVAAGVVNALTADMIRPGAVVIDVGTNRIPDATRKSGSRLVGDVDFANVKEVASWITPVPGGVGPMTVTMLLSNTVDAAERATDVK